MHIYTNVHRKKLDDTDDNDTLSKSTSRSLRI